MCKPLLWAGVVVALMSASASAATYAEKLKAVDDDKKTITFAVEGKDQHVQGGCKVDVQSQVRRGKRSRSCP